MQQRSSRYTRWLAPVLGGALLLSSAACDGDDFTNVAFFPEISVSSGDRQTGAAGRPLAQPIVVRVSDQNGFAIPNALVNWTVLFGGGSVSAASSQTDVNGNASITWTMGPTASVDSLRASLVTGASVIITATATTPVQSVSATGDFAAGVNQYRLYSVRSTPTWRESNLVVPARLPVGQMMGFPASARSARRVWHVESNGLTPTRTSSCRAETRNSLNGSTEG